jgi:C4-dicarboxylate transporter DctM subunit
VPRRAPPAAIYAPPAVEDHPVSSSPQDALRPATAAAHRPAFSLSALPLKLLDYLEEVIISALMAGATLIIFAAVVHRYASGYSFLFAYTQLVDFSWAQELSIFLFVWMAKFGAAYGVRTGIHVGVDVLVNRLPHDRARKVVLFSLACGALFTGVVGTLGASLVWHLSATGTQSNDLEAPMWIVYLAVPLGSYLMCFRFLQVALHFARTGDLPHHDVAHVEGVTESGAAPLAATPAAVATPEATVSPAAAPAGPVRTGAGLSIALVLAPIVLAGFCLLAKFGLLNLGPGLRTTIIFLLLVALMLTGMPVSIALGLTVLTFLFTLTEVPVEAVALKLFTGIEKFEIMAVPLFILAGNFLTHGGVARRMIAFANAMVGHWHGGLGLAAVMACALFAAVSGSSPATVVAIGSVILPAMVAQGFPRRFGAGVVTTAGALGILIPPSIAMVLYAVSTNASIGKLFIAGIVPGLMLATMLGMTTFYRAWRNGYPRQPKASLRERFSAFGDSIWGLLLIVIVIGGIYGGLFTPTEAAGMSAIYAFIIAVFVYKDLRLADLPKVLLSSASMSAMLLYIITNAIMFSFLMTHENIPQAMAGWLIAEGFGWISFLLVVNILLLLAGNVMEPSSIILILAPILFPVAMKLGIDPIHFGILITVNMEVGMCHPPVGLNLYVASGIAKMGISELTVAVWPWLLTMLVFLMIVTYWPGLSLFLPRLLGM